MHDLYGSCNNVKWGFQMSGFFLVVELVRGRSATLFTEDKPPSIYFLVLLVPVHKLVLMLQ